MSILSTEVILISSIKETTYFNYGVKITCESLRLNNLGLVYFNKTLLLSRFRDVFESLAIFNIKS